MSRCGDIFENRATGEHVVVLRGSEDRGAGPVLAHLLVRPGGAVAGEHVHPFFDERFTVLRGRLDARVDGRTVPLGPGQSALVEAGVPHDWWNASPTEDAHVLVEISAAGRAALGVAAVDLGRFELMIANLFGLSNDGKLDRHHRPPLLHAAVFAQEFADVIVFTRPPPAVQRALFAVLAPLGRLLGYRALEPRYAAPHGHMVPEPWALAAAGLASEATDRALDEGSPIDDAVAELIRRSEEANAALVRGDVERYRTLMPLTDNFTLMSPFGGTPSRSARLTDKEWEAVGRFFRNGTLTQELVEAYGSADMVVLAIIEHVHGEVGSLPAQDWPLRVTLVYRRDGAEWRLAHRHADALARGISLEAAAALAA